MYCVIVFNKFALWKIYISKLHTESVPRLNNRNLMGKQILQMHLNYFYRNKPGQDGGDVLFQNDFAILVFRCLMYAV